MARKRIDLLLVERGLLDSRAKARAAIEAGRVTAGGITLTRVSDRVDDQARIVAAPAHAWVGRGALKLVRAFEIWPLSPQGKVVLDIGSSTGGFTEVCLSGGARRVFAVDVGHGQLHPRLAGDPRVTVLEGVDARQLDGALMDEAPDLIVCDVSFIGLEKALPVALGLAASGADLIALVKPQFQLGPGRVGKGGLVKDEADRLEALESAKAFLRNLGWQVRDTADSPIQGGDGNREYLLWATSP